jgi:DNA-binding SARP family transcriptional activator
MPSGASVRSFGSFELVINDCPVERWRAGKARNLFQLLLLQRGKVIPKETLYASLWPEAPWTSNSSSLKVAVHVLRRILSAHESSRPDSSLTLRTHQTGYSLEMHDGWIDFEMFDQFVNEGRTAQRAGDRTRALKVFREAERLYRGHFLPDVELDWANVRREWLRSRVLCVMEYLVEFDIATGNHLAVIDRCHRMLEYEPCREETYRALMVAHGRLGQLSQVGRWYRLCATRLRDELQIRPSGATERLYRHARRGGLVTPSSPRELCSATALLGHTD